MYCFMNCLNHFLVIINLPHLGFMNLIIMDCIIPLRMGCTICRNPTLVKCEDETHFPKVGDLESSGPPELLELDNRGKNTLHWGVFYINGKVLKCRCPKWPRMSHLDICSPSYGQKKGWESNWQFDSRPLKVGNRPLPNVFIWSAMGHWKALEESYNFGSDLTPIGGRSQEL